MRAPFAGQRAYLFGQAPGIVEGEQRLPWRGRAGQMLRRWLELDEETFYATFYCASVTRCYPGRAASGRGDRTPAPREQELCEHWRDRELALLRPGLIVTVGGLALKRMLGRTELTECVGERFDRDGAVVVPLPTPPARAAGRTFPQIAHGWTGHSDSCERSSTGSHRLEGLAAARRPRTAPRLDLIGDRGA